MDADDLLMRLEGIGTVDEAATWAAQACLEITTLRSSLLAVADITNDWGEGYERSDSAMERIVEVLALGGRKERRH